MLIQIGYENYLERKLVATVLQPDSSHAKRLRKNAEEKGLLINATSGHKTRSVIVLTTNQVVLSAVQPPTLQDRFDGAHKKP